MATRAECLVQARSDASRWLRMIRPRSTLRRHGSTPGASARARAAREPPSTARRLEPLGAEPSGTTLACHVRARKAGFTLGFPEESGLRSPLFVPTSHRFVSAFVSMFMHDRRGLDGAWSDTDVVATSF